MERLERPQQLNQKLSGQWQIETGSILGGVKQSAKAINVSAAVFRSEQLPVFASLLDRRCWLKRRLGLITGASFLYGDSDTRRQNILK